MPGIDWSKKEPKEFICRYCGETFYKKTVHAVRCDKCKPSAKKEYAKQWYRSDLENNRELRKIYSRKQKEKDLRIVLLYKSRSRAKERSLEFNLKLSDIIIPEYCPALKRKLLNNTPYAASLDRINPKEGYVKGNVQVISRKANTMKNNATPTDLKNFANWILQIQ